MLKARYSYMDIAKGVGIILVILGHTNTSLYLNDFIYSFHMPLFFIISGYLYSRKEIKYKEFIWHKFKSLLIPYIIFFIISAPITLIKNNFSLSHLIKSLLFYGETSWNTPIWFLIVLFSVYIIYFLVDKLNNKQKNLCITVFLLLGYLCYKNNIVLIMGLQVSFIGVFLFNIGTAIKEFDISTIKNKEIIIVVLFSITLLFSVVLGNDVDMVKNIYGNFLYFIITSITGSLMIIIISTKIQNNNILEFFGKNTMVIMGLHFFIILGLNKVINIILGINILTSNKNDILSIIITIIILIIFIPIIKVVNIYMPWLSGRFNKNKTNNIVNK